MSALLTHTVDQSDYLPVAAQSATGFSGPICGGESRIEHALRLFSCLCSPVFYGRPGGEAVRPAGCRSRSANPVRSSTSFSGVVGGSLTELRAPTMSYDAQEAPASAARQLAHYFGQIADTLDWNHTAWLALQAALQALGKAPEALTLADVAAAIASINADLAEVRQ